MNYVEGCWGAGYHRHSQTTLLPQDPGLILPGIRGNGKGQVQQGRSAQFPGLAVLVVQQLICRFIIYYSFMDRIPINASLHFFGNIG